MSYEFIHTNELTSLREPKSDSDIQDYSEILYQHDLQVSYVDCYLQVGEVNRVQGWILHVSIVRSQIPMVLNRLIPLLRNTPFRVVQNKETARSLLDGCQGPALVGKVINIFPNTDIEAAELAKRLIAATAGFEGPAVLTDIHLGGLIYTSHGGFNPIFLPDASGKQKPYIFDKSEALVEDIARIPFRLSNDIDWPFSSIASPVIHPPKKIIKGKYLPVKLLKADSKGDVTKSLYTNSRLGIHWCVVKQGKRNMWTDESGRDMRCRLAWQRELYRRMGSVVSMPAIIDLFEENGDAYLVQEYIPSKSLMEKIYSLNKNCRSWHAWMSADRLVVLDYLLQVLEMVSQIHRKNIVHRDLTPVNFLVRHSGQLVLIDSEIAYDLSAMNSYRPFIGGTIGFMSPEQAAAETPTAMEDVYALGAFMLTILTGLAPLTVGISDLPLLRKKLLYFLRDEGLSRLIVSCLQPDPTKRPLLGSIDLAIKGYNCKAHVAEVDEIDTDAATLPGLAELTNFINKGIRGLMEEPMPMHESLWLSRNSAIGDTPGKPKNSFSKSGGIYEGITGVLYFLARAKELGLDISACRPAYEKGWIYIQQVYLDRMPDIPAGLYGGGAGIALAMAMGLRAGLLENTPGIRASLAQCLSLPNSMPDVATGVAGQGIATLQCREYLEEEAYRSLLESQVHHLLTHQYRDKYWVFRKSRLGTPVNAIGFSNGNTGITWFLLAYYDKAQDSIVHHVVLRSLELLKKEAKKLIRQIDQRGIRGLITGNIKILDGLQGLVLVFTKAYEVFQEPVYKDLVEVLLDLYPMQLVHDNVFQEMGLAGIGELHLEAHRVLQVPVFKKKADGLIQYFLHTYQEGINNGRYWIGNNADFPTADFMTGNAGVLHFLMRGLPDSPTGYRLLG